MDGEKILVFCSSKRRCDALTRDLRVDGWPALTIHGDKAQEERDWVLQQFKDGEQPLLIATNPSPSPSPSPNPNPNPKPNLSGFSMRTLLQLHRYGGPLHSTS